MRYQSGLDRQNLRIKLSLQSDPADNVGEALDQLREESKIHDQPVKPSQRLFIIGPAPE